MATPSRALTEYLRPILISNATRLPFLIVIFGVLGGLAAFGLVGLLIGPVVLAVAMAVWREWLQAQSPSRSDAPEDGEVK